MFRLNNIRFDRTWAAMSIDSESFQKTPFIVNKICTTILWISDEWKLELQLRPETLPWAFFSLRNPKKFRTCEPFKFSNARFFYPCQIVEKFSNATFFRQIASQNPQRKTLGFLRLRLFDYRHSCITIQGVFKKYRRLINNRTKYLCLILKVF